MVEENYRIDKTTYIYQPSLFSDDEEKVVGYIKDGKFINLDKQSKYSEYIGNEIENIYSLFEQPLDLQIYE